MRRGAGVVERARLESGCILWGTEGSNPSLSAIKQNYRFSVTGFFASEPRYSVGFRLVQAYRGISIPSRHVPALALSWADILCDCPWEAYPSSAVVTFAEAIEINRLNVAVEMCLRSNIGPG